MPFLLQASLTTSCRQVERSHSMLAEFPHAGRGEGYAWKNDLTRSPRSEESREAAELQQRALVTMRVGWRNFIPG